MQVKQALCDLKKLEIKGRAAPFNPVNVIAKYFNMSLISWFRIPFYGFIFFISSQNVYAHGGISSIGAAYSFIFGLGALVFIIVAYAMLGLYIEKKHLSKIVTLTHLAN